MYQLHSIQAFLITHKRNFVIIGISLVLAYFIDQYYILGKGWWFLLELVQ